MSYQPTSSTSLSSTSTPYMNIQRFTSPTTAVDVFPWNGLPIELKLIILTQASEDMLDHTIPIHFGLVSRDWRVLTLGLHSWWSEVSLTLDIPATTRVIEGQPSRSQVPVVSKVQSAKKWLSRAGQRKTKIEINHIDSKAIFLHSGYYRGLYELLFGDEVLTTLSRLTLDVHPQILGCILDVLRSHQGGCGNLKDLGIFNSGTWDMVDEANLLNARDMNVAIAGGTGLYLPLEKMRILDMTPDTSCCNNYT